MKKRNLLNKYVSMIYRASQGYLDDALRKYELSSGTYPFILALYDNEGISQNALSEYVKVDKALSARAIKRLIELGYVEKIINSKDARAYKLYLTEKAKVVVPEVRKSLDGWLNIITNGLTEEEKETAECLLQDMYMNIKESKAKN
ncbi:MarR family transcriptional regulator [Clostridium botulinum]|uniref:Transcriptional regulator, MarR family n=1 Tax=Clostridium botulinum (strain Okra / Type B1) TaxID=498213 RepID=B1IDQ6_CLOBK|nr:MarR family transcriptional regulator [Clostridium botulinum]EKX81116.1 MarR family transcriptional regulator [Clostridium botulinum CFSAN001628]ACA45493.1 transcriptional regulator, MarR family [Clostridium botulinum B1 str. Okra]MBD5564785.1 MarR family transcriptional regulator [Clostridium botulinum]MBD5565187.1 MarR family transcriptional regulator [Clostridium botulinum]MBD5570810.1 MarR family transcriptional regulator [Clostridium botulinum]